MPDIEQAIKARHGIKIALYVNKKTFIFKRFADFIGVSKKKLHMTISNSMHYL